MSVHCELIGSTDLWPSIVNMELFSQKHINFVSIGKNSTNLHTDFQLCNKIKGNYYIFCENDEDTKYIDSIKEYLVGKSLTFNKDIFEKLNYNFIRGDMINSCKISDIDTFFNNMDQIDMCKIDMNQNKDSRMILYKLLDNGFRPSVIYIRFEECPDEYVPVKLCTGHIQNCGYSLIGIHENKYIFYFTGECLYDICYWGNPSIENPLELTIKRDISVDISNKSVNYLNGLLNKEDLDKYKRFLASLMGARVYE